MSSERGLNRIAERTLASAEDMIAVDGLSLAGAGALRMIATLVNPTEDFVGYYLYFNGDHEDAHYWRQFVGADDEAVTSGRRNDPRLMGLDPGDTGLVEATLAPGPDGLVRATVSVNRSAPEAIVSLSHKIVWTVPVGVTRIAVAADEVDGVGAGSSIIVMNTGDMV